MIIVNVIGGLGNQLFQLAYAIELSKKSNEKIYIDIASFNSYKIRSFSLDNFFVSNVYSKELPLCLFDKLKYKVSTKLYRVYQKVIKCFNLTDSYGSLFFHCFSKYGYVYNFDPFYYELESPPKKVFLYGYFQSENYFSSVKSEIMELFQVQLEMTSEEKFYYSNIKESTSIAISLRLGDDYFNCKELNVCDESYYVNAIKKIDKLVEAPGKKYFIFSDDIVKAKCLMNTFPEKSFIFIENMSDYQSLRLMSNCCHFVIPNSSFSWWGAYLSTNANKMIVSPDQWYNSIEFVNDIYTPEMLKLSEI